MRQIEFNQIEVLVNKEKMQDERFVNLVTRAMSHNNTEITHGLNNVKSSHFQKIVSFAKNGKRKHRREEDKIVNVCGTHMGGEEVDNNDEKHADCTKAAKLVCVLVMKKNKILKPTN